MKSASFLLTLFSFSAASVVPIHDRNIGGYLEARVNEQQLTNPDQEPPYRDATSGALVEKSRILSNVGPDAANRRYFDWDESCTDAGQRKKIEAAWDDFQELTTRSSTQLATLRDSLPEPVENLGNPNPKNREVIIQNDPAYTQMFKARDTGLQYVQDSFASITANVKNFPARGNGGPAALRFICNADDHVKNGKGDSYCGSGPQAAQAQTLVPQGPGDSNIEQKYSFERSSSIVFCPVFFDDQKFPNIVALAGQPDPEELTLDRVDCRERIMLHEFLHLPWTRNMDPEPDEIGYYKAAQVAERFRWNDNRSMPDCYAWYAMYSFFNNVHEGCGNDIWPPGVKKPVSVT